ncbi:MAG: class I SAM-dependent methyltransferase [Candidatus Nanopelagicales bacterium]
MTESHYSHEYFSNVYRAKDELGNPNQTKIDKFRDQLSVRMYKKYGPQDIANSDVIDIGCGYGWLLDYFENARSVSGSDISLHALELAKKRNPNRDYKYGDIQESINFDKKFDLVLAINVIEHLTSPERAIKNISNALKPNGIAIVHMPTVSNRLNKFEYKYLYDSDPTHIYRPKGKTVRKIFISNQMKVVRESYLPHFPAWLTKIYPIHPAYLAVFRKI